METTQTHLRSNPSSTLARPSAQTAVASPAPQNPSACLHTVASGTLQPGLHHHTLLHPLPAGKSPAAGWPLSTGLVLLHEMNRCGVGVGETGCGERSRGSGCPGVPGDSREQPSSSQPGSPGSPQQPPQGLLDLAFFFLCQATATPPAPQTSPAMSTCTFTLCHPLGFVPTLSQCPSVLWVCRWGGFALVEDGRSLKSHWYSRPNLSNITQGAGRPAALWVLVKPNQILLEAIST